LRSCSCVAALPLSAIAGGEWRRGAALVPVMRASCSPTLSAMMLRKGWGTQRFVNA
jgi:hypothetical protein